MASIYLILEAKFVDMIFNWQHQDCEYFFLMTLYFGFSSYKYVFFLLNCYRQVEKILKYIFLKEILFNSATLCRKEI